jgi:hypothetical protein
MPLGTTNWATVFPVAQTNLCLNPSFERGTTGVAAIQSAGIGSASDQQQFGAWSCFLTPNSNGTSGGAFGTWTAGNGTDYTVSAYVKGQNGIPYMIGVGDSNGVNLLGSTAFTGGGTWHRHAYSFSEASGAVRRVVIRKTSGANTGTVYIDGVNIVAGSITTHIDGDQEGCIWLGAPHASQSSRDGQSRAGGSVIALADLGFTVDEALGIGMPPLETTEQSYAIIDGGQFQRQRAAPRSFTLSASLNGAAGEGVLQGLHAARKRIIDALKIDLVTPQQPTRFWYTGAGGTVQIDAVMVGGLEQGGLNGYLERPGVQFVAHDPYWRTTTQEGTALAGFATIGSVQQVAQRTPDGRWGTMAGGLEPNASFPNIGVIYPALNGSVYFGGDFISAGGTATQNLAFWNGQQWGTLVGGTVNGEVFAVIVAPSGTVFAAGNWTTVAGTAGARWLAQWNANGWGTLIGGTVNNQVSALAIAPSGTLYVGGGFTEVAGTSSRFMAQWTPSGAWGTLAGGTMNGTVNTLALGLSGTLYAAGEGGQVSGSAAGSIAQWNPAGSWGTLAGGVAGGPIFSLVVAPSNVLYALGAYTSAGGGSANAIAGWNGAQWTALGSGLLAASARRAWAGSSGALAVVGGFGTAGGVPTPSGAAIWTGAAWVPIDLLGATTNIRAIAVDARGTTYISLANGALNNGTAAAVVDLVNHGAAAVYPTLRVRNTGATLVRLYQLLNITTGDGVFFNYSLLAGEEIVLKLQPGQRSFRSSFRGNIFGAIMGGSDLASWRLSPGTNAVSFLADSLNLQTDLYWQHTAWSADQGRIN